MHFGVASSKLPGLLIFFLFLLFILPGAIVWLTLAKEYFVGVTGQRLIVLQMKQRYLGVKEHTEYSLKELAAAGAASVNAHHGQIDLDLTHPTKPVRLIFRKRGMPNNQEQAASIVAKLTGG